MDMIKPSKKGTIIYRSFAKAPIYDMVQYLVDQDVDAQVLHQLKLMDIFHQKNRCVKSYAQKVYDAYEQVCQSLVTYPSLAFKDGQYHIRKQQHDVFLSNYFGESVDDRQISNDRLEAIVALANLSLLGSIEGYNRAISLVQTIVSNSTDVIRLTIFLKEVSGDDYRSWIQQVKDNV